MQNNSFFDEAKEQSQVKARIVEKYFWAWANVIIGKKNKTKLIGYVDFFSGPGSYETGTKSTPLLVLEKAIENEKIRDRLVSVFNDAKLNYAKNLEESINLTQGIDTLKYYPIVTNLELGEEEDVSAQIFDHVQGIPTLFFVDPWGYKGLTLSLIITALQDWGCDCMFFFNYNSINRSIKIQSVAKHIDALFGKKRATELRNLPSSMSPSERELTIIETISQALKENAGQYVLPFRFKSDSGSRSSHHMIFVSKHIKGYEIMKEIMANESTESNQGVASFEYNPAIRRYTLLFELSRPLDDLAEMLLEKFAGETMTRQQIYDKHHVDTPYIKKNYRKILIKLEDDGKIQTDPPANKRRKNTFSDTVKVTFPPKDK